MNSGEAPALSVSELYGLVEAAITGAAPRPVWVRGEITGLRRTSHGALFFRLADESVDDRVVDVAARGRIAADVDRALEAAGVGRLRDGVAVRLRATLGVEARRSSLRLSLLQVDPAFTAGRLAVDRAAILRKLAADGSLAANARLPLPLVPLRVGLVTSRGSAAHADLMDHLRRSGFRFQVRTAHAAMQGESAATQVCRSLERLGREGVDVIALVRGGGAKLDLAAFDTETVGRAVAAAPVPVVTGIGHEIDRTVADEAAALSLKTPTAVGEWLVTQVGDFAGRVDLARRLIATEARAACARESGSLQYAAAMVGSSRAAIDRQHEVIDDFGAGVSQAAREAIELRREWLTSIEEAIADLGVEATLQRGFALVKDRSGRAVRSVQDAQEADVLTVRFADGEVRVRVGESRHEGHEEDRGE